MKRAVFISVLFLLELNISGAGLLKEIEFNTISRADITDIRPLLEIRPQLFTNKTFNSSEFLEVKKYYLSLGNTVEDQNSKNKFQAIQSYIFILEEGNSSVEILPMKKPYIRKKETKNKAIIVKPNSNLIKVPP